MNYERRNKIQRRLDIFIVPVNKKILNATRTVMALEVQRRVQCERTQDALEYKPEAPRLVRSEIFGRRSESEQTPAAPGKWCIFTNYNILYYYIGWLP